MEFEPFDHVDREPPRRGAPLGGNAGSWGTPGKPSLGRPRGTVNKFTKRLKEMVEGALDEAGGQKYLLAVAQSDPKAFVGLLAKVLPKEHILSFRETEEVAQLWERAAEAAHRILGDSPMFRELIAAWKAIRDE